MRSFIALSLLVACGSHGASVEDLRRSKSLACVLDHVEPDPFLIDSLDDDGSPAAVRGLALALYDRGKLGDDPTAGYVALIANALATRGAREDARALLALPGIAALPDDAEVGIGVFVGEVRMRAGLPAKGSGDPDRALIEVSARALGGDLAGAKQELATVNADEAERYHLASYVTALAAVGRDADADTALAAGSSEERLAAAKARLDTALETGHGIIAAVASVVAYSQGASFADEPNLRQLDGLARATGHTADLAPYRRLVIQETIANVDPEHESLAIALADVTAADGAADERASIDPALARIPADDYRHKEVTATDALHRDTLDAALAAIENVGISEPILSLRLWLRHASAGLDPGFEARMIDACHAD